MRIACFFIALPIASAAVAAPALPAFDIAKTCQDQAAYAFSATLGQVDLAKETAFCEAREQASRDLANVAWARVPDGVRKDCAGLSEGRYTRLEACLSDDRTRRSAR